MKRDMELVRNILLKLEEKDDFRGSFQYPEAWDDIKVAYHLKIMEQAGLVEQKVNYADDIPIRMFATITWEGQEFLDSIKNKTVWTKLKNKLKEEGGSLPFHILKSLAVKYSEQHFL
ncbi:DUF2513 domain-containing protein [Bacillus sp. A301a_S52]|jgi:hypothetical protein|nr:DUF2513 domain-containing protein [Bacillus sp. A301a_S52]